MESLSGSTELGQAGNNTDLRNQRQSHRGHASSQVNVMKSIIVRMTNSFTFESEMLIVVCL